MFEIKPSKKFVKQYAALTQQEQKAVKNKLALLAENQFHPSLRTKKYHTSVNDIFEMSVNMDIRVLWRYEDKLIILALEVGHHKDILGVYNEKHKRDRRRAGYRAVDGFTSDKQ